MQPIPLRHTLFEGNNTVYLLGADGDGPLTLVDSGTDAPEIREQLEAGIEETGHAVEDVDQVLLTHFHADHSGLANWVQNRSGATVRIHEVDAALAAPSEETLRAFRDRQKTCFEAWGMPDEKREEVLAVFETEADVSSDPLDLTFVADGDVLEAGSRELTVHHLPGHTAGHVCYEDATAGVLFSGDVLLPKYTPNVGGADVRLDNPLADYLDSLERVVGLASETAWPGHRDRIDDPVGRARVILDHHRERTENVVAVLREHGALDPWGVSAELFGELHGIHVLHGPGEASAHLRHLEADGLVTSTDGVYELADPDPDLDPLFPAAD